MTIASEDNRSGPYTGNGVTTIFSYTFRILNENHLRLILAEGGVETVLTIDADYIVSDVGDAGGGQVALTHAPTVSQTLTILRDVPFTQELDLENQGAYFAENIEEAFDQAVMRDQQISERLDRALVVPASADTGALEALIADVVLLATKTGEIHTVATIADDVSAVAAIDDDVHTVASIAANVTTVATIADDVSAVAAIDDDVHTVASIAANVTTVATIADDVSAVAGSLPQLATKAPLLNPAFTGYLDLAEIAAPGTPAAGRSRIYVKADGKLYIKNEEGVEVGVGTGGNAVVSPELFGAVGDGVANDTVAVQSAFDAMQAIGPGAAIVLRAGAIYSVTNIKVPNLTNDWRRGRVSCPGSARFKRRAGGDADYMFASARWLSGDPNKIYPCSPIDWENVAFDANHLCNYAFVDKSYGSEYHGCYFDNALADGRLFTRKNQDGTLGSTGYLSGSKMIRCDGGGNAGWWFRTQGTAANDTDAPTDGHIIECQLDSGGGVGGIYLANAGGWTLRGNHTFSFNGADNTDANLHIAMMGNAGSVASNTFEGLVVVGNCGHLRASMIGPGNNFWTGLRVDFVNDTSEELLAVAGNIFSQTPAAAEAVITHNQNRSTKTIVSDNAFIALQPHVFGSGVTLGMFEVINRISGNWSSGPDASKMYFDRLCAVLTLRESDLRAIHATGFTELRAVSGVRNAFLGVDDNNAYMGVYQNIPLLIQRGGNTVLWANATGIGFNGVAPVAPPAYGAPTGTATRTAFATGSVTLPQLAERVKALIDDLHSRGDFA